MLYKYAIEIFYSEIAKSLKFTAEHTENAKA
jgi:hypothetical protein